MPGTATVTGKIGGGATLTAAVFQQVTRFQVITLTEILEIDYTDAALGPRTVQIDVSAATTWTLTVSGNTYTLTVS